MMKRRGFFGALIGLALSPLTVVASLPKRKHKLWLTGRSPIASEREIVEAFQAVSWRPCDHWTLDEFTAVLQLIISRVVLSPEPAFRKVLRKAGQSYVCEIWFDEFRRTGASCSMFSGSFTVDYQQVFPSHYGFVRYVVCYSEVAWENRELSISTTWKKIS